MANPYVAPVISGYNSAPPPDDGSQTAANEITWAAIKEKLADPLKNYADAISAAASGAGNTFDTVTGSRLLQTQSFASTAAVAFIAGINNTYDEYEFVISNLSFSTNTTALLLQISEDAGVSYKNGASDYKYSIHTTDSSGAHAVSAAATSNALQLMTSISGASAGIVLGGRVRLYNPSVAGIIKPVGFELTYTATANSDFRGSGCYATDTGVINAVRFVPGAGSISGTISLYGKKK